MTENNNSTFHATSKSTGGFNTAAIVAFFGAVIACCVVGAAYGVRDVEHRTEEMYATEQINGEVLGGDVPSFVRVALTVSQKRGQAVYFTTCNKCHGDTGAGLPLVGANLRQSKFVANHTDAELLAFIKKGRQPDPKNPDWLKIGLMPEKGLNPALKDDGILDVISYVRTFQATPKP